MNSRKVEPVAPSVLRSGSAMEDGCGPSRRCCEMNCETSSLRTAFANRCRRPARDCGRYRLWFTGAERAKNGGVAAHEPENERQVFRFSLSPRRHEWGESRREGWREKPTSSPRPSPPFGEEREKKNPVRTRFMATIRVQSLEVFATHEPSNRFVDLQRLTHFGFMGTKRVKIRKGATHEPADRSGGVALLRHPDIRAVRQHNPTMGRKTSPEPQRGNRWASGARAWHAMFLWLSLVAGSSCGDALAAPESCVDCHKKSSPLLVSAWEQSVHAAEGVGCAECHGEDHSTIFAIKGRVSAGICGDCHPKQEKQFGASLHAMAVDTMIADPKFAQLSPIMAEMACNSCHQIGARFPDGSRGSCNSCHSGHSFSIVEARQPDACASCHSGPDHAQMEMWTASKHGQLFAAEETRNQAPTCVTCHMPDGTHNTGVGLTFGNVASGGVLSGSKPVVKMRSISAEEAEDQRDLMTKTCLPCHSSRFASESLANADRVKQEADALVGRALEIISGLEKNPPSQRDSEKKAGDSGSRTESSMFRITDQGLDALSPVGQRFFNMVKFHHATMFKGAYHHSPVHTFNKGLLPMNEDLNFFRNEASHQRNGDSK